MSSRTGRHQHHARGPDISEESPFWDGGMDNEQAFPVIRQTVLDTTDPRRLAEFYRRVILAGRSVPVCLVTKPGR